MFPKPVRSLYILIYESYFDRIRFKDRLNILPMYYLIVFYIFDVRKPGSSTKCMGTRTK